MKKKVTLLENFKLALMSDDKSPTSATTKDVKTEPAELPMAFEPKNGHGEAEDPVDLSTYLVHVKKWMKTKHAHLFRLNNKLVQMVFLDNTQILLSSVHKKVIYLNKKGERLVFDAATAMTSDNLEMVKRLKYSKEILNNILSKNGGVSSPNPGGAEDEV